MSPSSRVKTPSGQTVIIDNLDLRRLDGRSISIGSHGYAQVYVGEPPRMTTLHRWITGLPVGDPRICDHINGDKLDNRRANLRVVDGTTSNLNRSVKGRCVYPTPGGRWQAVVYHRRRQHHLGTFEHEHEAAQAVEDFRRERGIVHLRFAQGASA